MESEEDVRRALAEREAEAAELQEKLLQAAVFGQELVAQNEELKELLRQRQDNKHRFLAVRGKAERTGSSDTTRQVHFGSSKRESSVGSSRSDMEAAHSAASAEHFTPLLASARVRRGRTVSLWEQLMHEKVDIEEERERLLRRCQELEEELELRAHQDSGTVRTWSRVHTRSVIHPGPQSGALSGRSSRSQSLELQEDPEKRLRLELEAGFRDHLEELEVKYLDSEALVQQLRKALSEREHYLSEANERYSQLWQKAEEHKQDLLQARETIREQDKQLQRELTHRSASMMRRTLRSAHHLTADSFGNSLAEEVIDGDLEEIEQEKAELMEEVSNLRGRLSAMEEELERTDVAGRAQPPPGGADAGGGGEDRSRVATGSAVDQPCQEQLKCELQEARKELDEVRKSLKKANSRPSLFTEPKVTARASASLEPLGLWGKLLLASHGILCCTSRTSSAGRRGMQQPAWEVPDLVLAVPGGGPRAREV